MKHYFKTKVQKKAYYLETILSSVLENISIGNFLQLLLEVSYKQVDINKDKTKREEWARKARILKSLVDYLYSDGGKH